MLTHDVRVAFSPKSMVTGLTISKDGSALAWSEKNGTLNVSVNGLENKYVSIDGSIQGIFFDKKNLYCGDDNFGLRCLDNELETIWECEIDGGTSLIEKCDDFVAVVDNLGRLLIVDYTGNITKRNLHFNSVIRILSSELGLIIVQEDGSVFCFDGENTIWKRPARGKVGESITGIGVNLTGELIIGREGYALVPGDEEALELEVWDIKNDKLIMRDEVKSRLIEVSSGSKGGYLGFDDGSICLLEKKNGSGFQLSKTIADCKFPIKTLDVINDGIIAGSWFYLHGIMNDGKNWMIEHQGIIQYTAYSKISNSFYFAGDDQNDYTNNEPIGVIDISNDLLERDKSELTEWFETPSELETAKPEDIYSEDDKFESLVIDSQTEHGFDDLSQLLSALEEEESSTDSEVVTSTNEDTILQDLYGYEPVINMPIASAGDDQKYKSGDEGSAIIILDSSNTKGDINRIVSYSWVDESGKEISDLPKLRVKLAIGNYRFELRITDDEGNSTSDSIQVDVV